MTEPLRHRSFRRGLEGAQRAADHADRACSPSLWSVNALRFVRAYALTHSLFMAEEVREWATTHGFPPPPDPRAWGHIITTAKRQGMIEASGEYRMTSLPPAHSGPRVVWRSLVLNPVDT